MQSIMAVVGVTGQMGVRGLCYGMVLGALYGTVFGPPFGNLYGAYVGILVGLPLGVVGGLVIGIVTQLFFVSVNDSHVFHSAILFIGALVAFGGANLGFGFLFGGLDLATGVIPALIATFSALWVCHNYTNRYLIEHGEEPRLNQQRAS